MTSRTLLCVSNFPANTGFAWDFIESLYAGLAGRLASRGVRTLVAYPRVDAPPAPLEGSVARAVELQFNLSGTAYLREVLRFVRREGVEALYLSDRPSWHPSYLLLRLAGVGTIVVHDHTSGARTRPSGLRKLAKWTRVRIPGTMADRVLGVSEYVVRRKLEVELLPEGRVERVWNSVELSEHPDGGIDDIRARFGLAENSLVIACASRASAEKGIPVLLRAFDQVAAAWTADRPLELVYMGDGPAISDIRRLAADLDSADAIHLPGYVPGAPRLIATADLAVVPSVWQEAFGLAALEPMARGVPVVASSVGGLPEIIRDGREGLLVTPGDATALSRAMTRLLQDPEMRRKMGERGRVRARTAFDRSTQLDRLEEIFVREMGLEGRPEP